MGEPRNDIPPPEKPSFKEKILKYHLESAVNHHGYKKHHSKSVTGLTNPPPPGGSIFRGSFAKQTEFVKSSSSGRDPDVPETDSLTVG